MIVGQLNRSPGSIQTIGKVRDVTYGLCSVFFAGFIIAALPGNAARDPLVLAEQTAVEEVTAWVRNKLAEVTHDGRRTAPNIPALLETLESSLEPLNHHEDLPNNVINMKRKEIARLKALYADWEPINKQSDSRGEQEEPNYNQPENRGDRAEEIREVLSDHFPGMVRPRDDADRISTLLPSESVEARVLSIKRRFDFLREEINGDGALKEC